MAFTGPNASNVVVQVGRDTSLAGLSAINVNLAPIAKNTNLIPGLL